MMKQISVLETRVVEWRNLYLSSKTLNKCISGLPEIMHIFSLTAGRNKLLQGASVCLHWWYSLPKGGRYNLSLIVGNSEKLPKQHSNHLFTRPWGRQGMLLNNTDVIHPKHSLHSFQPVAVFLFMINNGNFSLITTKPLLNLTLI